MSNAGVSGVILAVVAGYGFNGILVAISEQLLSSAGPGGALPSYYYPVDLASQCLYTVAAGYLCCWIARPTQWAALAGLMGLGVVIGAISLAQSWKSEPRWYGIALFVVFAPCAWLGWMVRSRTSAASASVVPD
jgi:hypothetical protein